MRPLLRAPLWLLEPWGPLSVRVGLYPAVPVTGQRVHFVSLNVRPALLGLCQGPKLTAQLRRQ